MSWEFYNQDVCEGDVETCHRCRAGVSLGGEDYPLERCPRELDLDYDLCRVLSMGKQGHLPVSGGTLEQTNFFLEALQVFVSAVNEMEEFEMEKARDGSG